MSQVVPKRLQLVRQSVDTALNSSGDLVKDLEMSRTIACDSVPIDHYRE